MEALLFSYKCLVLSTSGYVPVRKNQDIWKGAEFVYDNIFATNTVFCNHRWYWSLKRPHRSLNCNRICVIFYSFDLNLLSRWIPQLTYGRKLQEQLFHGVFVLQFDWIGQHKKGMYELSVWIDKFVEIPV